MAGTLYPSHTFPFFEAHHWEDWVELCCLANPDGEADAAGMAERLRQELETRKRRKSTIDQEIEDDESEGLLAEAEWATAPDKKTIRVKAWFLSLADRAKQLGDSYPFGVGSDNATIKLRANITDTHRLYIALLMMSNLHYFDDKQSDLTSDFENIGESVFKWLLPAHAEVHRFGKGKGNDGRYKGHIWDKLKLLADDLSCKIKCVKDDFAKNDTGEAGLDLVGWVPWQDSASGRLLLFGQCACTPKWASKQHDASAAVWNSKLDLITNPLTVILIPYFLRSSGGAWFRHTDFAGFLVIDRLRFIRVLGATADKFKQLSAFTHVATCLAAKEEAY